MISGEASAWLCGLAAGAIIGAAAVYALYWHAFAEAGKLKRRAARLCALLFELQAAEGRYRQKADTLRENHPQTIKAWDEMREAGNAARAHIFIQGRIR